MMDDDSIALLQDIEYMALVEIKKICDANNITFFLRSGSVLGAIKYQDFVPWDDDIDIALFRDDYLRLIELMPEEFGERFRFICYQKTEQAHCYFPRVVLNERARIELGLPSNNAHGLVLLDILPIDGMPDKLLRLHIARAYIYRVLAGLWTLDAKDIVSMHNEKQQKVMRFLHALGIHHLYTQDSIYRKMDKLYAKYTVGTTKRAGMLAGSKLKREILRTEWWGGWPTCLVSRLGCVGSVEL